MTAAPPRPVRGGRINNNRPGVGHSVIKKRIENGRLNDSVGAQELMPRFPPIWPKICEFRAKMAFSSPMPWASSSFDAFPQFI